MSGAAVEIRGLEKRYGERVALAGIDLTIAEGEIFGLLGPNGAGKTTTVEILEGYRRSDAGSVRVLGADPHTDAARSCGPQVGVMLQEGGLYPGLKPLELLRLYAAFYDDADDPERLLDVVGLRDAAGTAIRRLSGGQAQRLSLAAALIGRPRLVFLDEPTAGMDPRARADTWELVRGLRAGGTTVVLTTHYMDEAEQLCDRLAILDRGHIVAGGTPAEVTADAVEPCTRVTVVGTVDTAALAAHLDRPVTRRHHPGGGVHRGRRAVARARRRPRGVAAATPACRSSSCGPGSASLEEVFLRLTEEPEVASGPTRRSDRERARVSAGLDGCRTPAAAIAAQTRVELAMTLRRGESLMVTIAIPVGILVFFGKVDALGSSIKGDPIDFLVPGVLALAVMANAMVSLGIATGFERRYGVLKRLGSTPLSRGGLLAAKTVNVLIVEVVQAAVIIGTAARARLAASTPASSPRSRCCSSAPSRSPGSGCSWPARCGPRPTSRRPTACSSS